MEIDFAIDSTLTKNNMFSIIKSIPIEKWEDLKNISEIVGIAVGLKSAEIILKLNKINFSKILPSNYKLKRLDFITTSANNEKIEIETKGTSS